MINTYIMLGLVIVLSGIFFIILYEILSPYHEKIFIFFVEKRKKELKHIVEFVKGMSQSISAVSVVAIFIPIKGAEFGILLILFLFGIMLSRVAQFIQNKFVL